MPSASIDRVVGMDCYLHANDDTDGVMKGAARVLKRGSLMVFTDLMQADGYITGMEKVHKYRLARRITIWQRINMYQVVAGQVGKSLGSVFVMPKCMVASCGNALAYSTSYCVF